MAVVYRARDTVLGRTVALKFLPYGLSQHPTLTDLFYREARAAATLNHPAIVTIYDLGIAEGRPFISMEFVQGVDVLRLLQKRGPLPVGEAVWIALEAAAALEHAHRHGLVHRDVKPSNLMITVERTLKVMDFGLAALMASQRKETVVSGTPGYMAPEQFTGQPVDPRADVFGLAVTLYEMLVGELPFQGFTRNVKPQPPSATRVDVPVELDEVILQALEADPAKRPPSAASLASAIRNACHLPPPPEETA
jgi:serine/threonine-protein kinase